MKIVCGTMKPTYSCCLTLFFVAILLQCCWAYEVPKADFKIYRRGFEVSIPDEEGIMMFGFHGNLNDKIRGLEAGEWSGEIEKAENGRWIFRNHNAELKLGDTIYYRIFLVKNRLGYVEDRGVFAVDQYLGQPTFRSDGVYEVPQPEFKIHRKGFEVSIPDEENDITRFIFIANLANSQESSILLQWNRYVHWPVNGSLVIRDNSTQFELGDSISYIIAVRRNESYYYQDDIYEVKQYAQ